MSRTRKRIITGMAAALAVAAVVAPSASARVSISAESQSASSGDLSARTPTELGQSTGQPGGPKFARTPTELGQSTNLSSTPTSNGESGGFDWGDAAIVGGAAFALVLVGLGGVAVLNRRRDGIRKSRAPAVSS
jgi:hypothetical protein